MKTPTNGYIDQPGHLLLREWVSYWGISDSDGAAAGTTIVCSDLANEPSYQGQYVKVLSGDAAGQVRLIVNNTSGSAGTVAVSTPFTDSADAAVQIVSGTQFVIMSALQDIGILHYGTATSAGAADGSSIIDTGLQTPFTVDDEPIGMTVEVLASSTATLIGQRREIHDYDYDSSTLYFAVPFNAQVPSGTTYAVIKDRPGSSGGGPQPEPSSEESAWQLADYDAFDVADATADTARWSSEYISAGAADGTADINTTTSNRLHIDITAAAVAAAEYGVRRTIRNRGSYFITEVDATVTVTNENTNACWGGLSVSAGSAWDSNNYLRIYKRKYTGGGGVEGIAIQYNIAGGGVTTTAVLSTTQTAVAFKIERWRTIWRLYYSLSQAPRHRWVLAGEVTDTNNDMTNVTSTYLSVYNAEDAVGQQVTATFNDWQYYVSLGLLESIYSNTAQQGGALAYIGFCSPGMAASTTTILCPNLAGFPDDTFNTGYQMAVLRNANSLGASPEMEMRDITDYVGASGTFTTAAFSSNVEANDTVIVIHNSVATRVSVYGTADAGSGAGAVVDSLRTEGNDWWNGQLIMMLSGGARGQVRPIVDFVAATDTINVSPDFDAAVAAGDVYAILTGYADIPPRSADNTSGNLTSEVIGSKSDTADYTASSTTSSIMRLLKGTLGSRVLAEGTFTTSSTSVPADTGRAEADNYWNGNLLIPLTGSAAFQARRIVDFANVGGVFTIDPNNLFTAATGLVTYIVIADQTEFVPGVDGSGNTTPAEVQGNRSDTIPAMNAAPGTSTVIAHLKAILERIGATPADPDDSLLTDIGQRDDAATNDDMSDITTTSVIAKLRLTLNRLSSDAFTATIQGGAQTAVDAMMAALATYFSTAGAAWSVQVNGGVARGNLELVLEDFFAVVGCDGANIFDPSIGGAARTTLDAAFAALGTALGAEFDGSPDTYDVLVTGYDSSGTTQNGDGSVLERLEELRGGTSTATHNIQIVDGTAEQTVATISPIRHGQIAVQLDLNTLIAAGEGGTVIVRLKNMIDGNTFRTVDRTDFLVASDEVHPTVSAWVQEGTNTAQVTIQVNSAVSAQRAIPYRIIEAA